jgi:DnaJ-class molecular chaperone
VWSRQEEDKLRAKEWFNEVQEAYNTLTDPHKRLVYDTIGPEGLKSGQLIVPGKNADDARRVP